MGPMFYYDVIVFDQEDALIDQGLSLPNAIVQAVDAYLVQLLGVKPEGAPLYTLDEIKLFADSQGFDTDVEILNALLIHAVHQFEAEFNERDFDATEGRDLLAEVVATKRITESLGDLARRKNLTEFDKLLRSRGGGRRGLSRVLGLRNRWLSMAEGHLLMDNFVERLLAEAYLGDEMFRSEHGQSCMFAPGEGAIGLEKPWLDPREVASVRQRCSMAAVTRRSHVQAQHVLKKAELLESIEVVISSKPGVTDTFASDEALWLRNLGVAENHEANYAQRVGDAIDRIREQAGMETIPRVAYIGNCAMDGRNLNSLKERYRLTLIGCAFGHDAKVVAAQKEKGADFVIATPEQFSRVLSERPRTRTQEYTGR